MAQLTAPTITATLINGIDIRISGIQTANASGYKVRWGTLSGYGREETITPVDGQYTIDDTFARTTYFVAVMAVGDGSEYTDSDWSKEVTVVTEGTVDDTLTAPSITLYADFYNLRFKFDDLSNAVQYRYQIATTEAGLATAPTGGIVKAYNNNYQTGIPGLEPNTTYYVRFCVVKGKKCSAWSTPTTKSTIAITSTVYVNDNSDSGTGTLREAISTATQGTKIVLNVASITLDSVISSSNGQFVVESGLSSPTVIQPGNNNSLIDCVSGFFKNIKFTGNVGSNVMLKAGGFVDCLIEDGTTTSNNGLIQSCKMYRCTVKDCTAGGNGVYNCALNQCVIDGFTVTGSNQFGCPSNCGVADCVIVNGTAVKNGGGGQDNRSISTLIQNCNTTAGGAGGDYRSVLLGCVVQGCKANGGYVYGGGVGASYCIYCRILDCMAPLGGGAATYSGSNPTLKNSLIARCSASNGAGGYYSGSADGAKLTDCVIKDCSSATYAGAGQAGKLTRCVVTGCSSASAAYKAGGVLGGTIVDSLIVGNTNNSEAADACGSSTAVLKLTNCTIGVLHVYTAGSNYLYNTLYKSFSATPTGANVNTLCYDGYESTYFKNAAQGDYTLKHGSPAINAGDNSYVTEGDLDLAGQPRINGTAVDLGAYEFYSSQLDPPTFTVTPGAGGNGSVAFELPEGGVSIVLESDTTDQFSNPRQYTSSASPLTVSGYSGTVYFRARTIGATADEDSDWSAVTTAFFDATSPTVTANINPSTGSTVWRFAPELLAPNATTVSYFFTISDNVDPSPSYHWYIYDANNTLVDDGTGGYIPLETLPVAARYRIDLTATDTAGNTASATCTAVIACNRPTYTYTTGPGGTLTITYTLPTGADGADVRYKTSGGSWTTLTGVDNPCVIAGLDGTYDWQMRVTSTSDELLRSAYTLTETATLDAYPPVLTVPETAVDLTVGASVDLMTGVSAVDNQDANPTIHYTITDANGQTVEIGGQTEDLQTEDLSPGVYTIVYTASDATGNVATAERALKVRLAAPTFEISTSAGGTATLAFTLPEGAVGCDILPLSSESFNPPVWITDAPNPCILTGLNGPYYFYLKSVSPTGQYNSNNVRSSLYWLDAVTPTVTVEDKTRLEYVVGDTTVNLLAGVSATDDHDASVPLIYYLTDANNEIVEVDGTRNNIPSEDIPIGAFTVVYEATDSAGNKGYNDRPLLVLPTVLETPTIACVGLFNTTATISGLDVENAYGYAIDVDGEVTEIAVPQGGLYAIQNLTDNAAHTIRVKALGDWEEPVGHYRDSGWSNSVTVIIGNPAADNAPVITREQVTDRSITIGVSEYETSAGYFEIQVSEDKAFSSPMTLTKVPADEITIKGLKASTIYYTKLRAVFSESTTPWSNVLLFQTEDLGPITPADKLLYLRERIGLLRAYLADISNIDSVSIDGISESKYDREKLLKELADLEAEEARLANGGGRLRTMNIRWTIR